MAGARPASYDEVTTGTTGHAETVRVTYDPAVVRYDQLLRIFFSVVADPTTLNRQGPDEGTHYRSALVPLGGEQSAAAAAYLAQLRTSKLWSAPIVTRIERYKIFEKAIVDRWLEVGKTDFFARPLFGLCLRG